MITNQSINLAINYILNHITEDITVEEIAKHCNFSRYYFSRLFKIETGESIYEFIKRIKMEQSAFRLKAERNKSITEISSDYGYSSSNYSSAFKLHHKLSPIEFRRSIHEKSLTNPIYNDNTVLLESFEECSKHITIENFEDFPVIYERHKGSYRNLDRHWGIFQDKYKEYVTEQTLFLEFTYNDPSITNINECLYDVCMTVPENCMFENFQMINGGKFAVYHFKGLPVLIYTAYQNIFSVWLPLSNCEIDERYSFEIYRKIECNTMYMEIDFCIPIK